MRPTRNAFRWARFTGILLASALVLATAFIVGKGNRSDEPHAAPERSSVRAPSPSANGAVAAYLQQQAQLADPTLWTTTSIRRAAELRKILGSSELRQSVEESIQTAVGRSDQLGEALRAGRTVLARSAALGYRVVSYSSRRAVIDAWMFSLLGGEGIPLDLRLARYRATERWTGGAWLLASTRTVGEGSPVRFRGAPDLSARLAMSLATFRRLQSEP